MTLRGRQQVDLQRAALCIDRVDTGQRVSPLADLRTPVIELAQRPGHQLHLQQAFAGTAQFTDVIADLAGFERCLPVDLVADHRTQAVTGRGGQAQRAPQDLPGGQQPHPWQAAQARLQHAVQVRRLQRPRKTGHGLEAVTGFAPDLQLPVFALQQQAGLRPAQRPLPAHRHPGQQRLPPPAQETAGTGADLALHLPQTVLPSRHLAAIPCSQRSTV
ncbi:hypothetical protein D3C73_842100 [compost metagenome]